MIINSLSTTETLPEIFQEVQTIAIEQVDTTGQVILHCRHYGCNAECSKSIRCEINLNPGIALVPAEGGNPSTILHTYNINLPPKKNYKMNYCTEFTLVFSALPKNCTAFHFIEPDVPGGEGWVIRNIKRSATDVYKLTLGTHASWEGELDF